MRNERPKEIGLSASGFCSRSNPSPGTKISTPEFGYELFVARRKHDKIYSGGNAKLFTAIHHFRWAESCRLSLQTQGVVAHRERAAGRESGVAGSSPACEAPYLRHHLPIESFRARSLANRSQPSGALADWLSNRSAGPPRSSTATEHPDASGRHGFDSHRVRQFRRAAEFGLSA